MAYFFQRPGYLYFAKHPDLDIVKIGFSYNAEVRVKQLSFNGKHGIFTLLGAIPCKGVIEWRVHKRFSDSRIRTPEGTEFFRYSEIAKRIRAILGSAATRPA